MLPTAEQLQSLCDANSNAHVELRALYERLWSGVLGLELRLVIDPVLDSNNCAQILLSEGFVEPEALQQVVKFAADFLQQVTDVLANSQLQSFAEPAVDLDNRQRYRNSLLAKFEKSPLDFALLMRDCLFNELVIYDKFTNLPHSIDDGPPPSKRARQQQSDARRDNILLKGLLSSGGSKAAAEGSHLSQLSASILKTHASLLTRLSVRAKLVFVNEVCESELAQLGSDVEDTLESLERLRQCGQLSADAAAEAGMQLLASCFVVTSQSDRVIKKGKAKYELRLRHLCPRFLAQRLFSLSVAVLTEDLTSQLESLDRCQLEALHKESGLEKGSGQCTWCPGGAGDGGGPVLRLKFASLPREMAGSAGSAASGGGVCHRKFGLAVCTELESNEFKLPNGAGTLAICCAQPVVFITHDNQKPAATATVLHDTLAALPDRLGFETRTEMSACDAVRIFDQLAINELQRGLTGNQRDYLAGLLPDEDSGLSLTSLTKTKLPSLNRTLCDFVFACVKYAREFCPDLWREGLVFGFTSKYTARELLSQPSYPAGTFLLRFSETTCYLSATWKRADNHVDALEPFSPDELKSQRLEQLLCQKTSLTHLALADSRCINKDAALKPFLQTSSKQQARSVVRGYVPRTVLELEPQFQLSLTHHLSIVPTPDAEVDDGVTMSELLGRDPDQ